MARNKNGSQTNQTRTPQEGRDERLNSGAERTATPREEQRSNNEKTGKLGNKKTDPGKTTDH